MKTEAALYAYLVAQSGLTDLVSTRIYPLVIEQSASLPAIVYQRIASMPIHLSGDDDNLRDVSMGVYCIAENYDEVKDVQEQVETALNNYSGTMGGDGGVVVQRVFLENIGESFNDDMRVFIVELTYSIWAEEA